MKYEYLTLRRNIGADTAFIALSHELQDKGREGWRVHTYQVLQMGSTGVMYAYVLLERVVSGDA